jgi:hypothetical protein
MKCDMFYLLVPSLEVIDEYMTLEHCWSSTDRKIKAFGEQPVPVPLISLQIPHGQP